MKATKFKVGDIVVVDIDNLENRNYKYVGLAQGATYKISRVTKDSVYLSGDLDPWSPNWFKHSKEHIVQKILAKIDENCNR